VFEAGSTGNVFCVVTLIDPRSVASARNNRNFRTCGAITTPLVCPNARPRLDSCLVDDSFISPRALTWTFRISRSKAESQEDSVYQGDRHYDVITVLPAHG
jgi:hypothetical protein